MKFKRKHTEGPFKTLRFNIVAKDGSIIAQVVPWDESGCHEEDTANLRGMMMFDVMIDYLIERAEWLAKDTQFNDSAFDDGWKRKRQELLRLVEILTEAGVEVKE